MKKKLLSNWGLKLLSVLLAFVLWFMVIAIENPPLDQLFKNIPVKLLNTELLEDEGKVYEILEGSDVVKTVTVFGPRDIVNMLNSSDIVAEADFRDLTVMNTIAIKFSVPSYNKIESGNISGSTGMIKLEIEDKKTKNIELKVNTVGEVAKNYQIDSIQPDTNRISIWGPESDVSRVSYAAATVDVKERKDQLATREKIQLYDENDELITDSSVEMNIDYVRIAVNVVATKEVPVTVTVMGTPADGFRATGVVECSPIMVRIAGSSSALSNVTSIDIPEEHLNITGQKENMLSLLNVKDHLPDGIKLADNGFNGKLTVTVYIEAEVQKKIIIPIDNIQFTNIPQGFVADNIDERETYDLSVKGLAAQVSVLQSSNVRGTIDISAWMEKQGITELEEGTYQIQAVFNVGEDVTVQQPITVRVVLMKQENIAG